MTVCCPRCNLPRPPEKAKFLQWTCRGCGGRCGNSVRLALPAIFAQSLVIPLFAWAVIKDWPLGVPFALMVVVGGISTWYVVHLLGRGPRLLSPGPCCRDCGHDLNDGVCHTCAWQRPRR